MRLFTISLITVIWWLRICWLSKIGKTWIIFNLTVSILTCVISSNAHTYTQRHRVSMLLCIWNVNALLCACALVRRCVCVCVCVSLRARKRIQHYSKRREIDCISSMNALATSKQASVYVLSAVSYMSRKSPRAFGHSSKQQANERTYCFAYIIWCKFK